jgi:hypothetical protein
MANEISSATTHLFNAINGGRRCALICIRDYEKYSGIEVAGLLVHEAVHIWQEILRNIGEENPSEEFEAYSIQSISQNLMAEFIAQTNRGVGQP